MENKEIIIDAEDSVVGRLASFAAKQALRGKNIVVINSEKAIIVGKRNVVLDKYIKKRQLGKGVQKGPHIPSKPDMILRRMIRGMLPWDRTKGREAFKRIYCFNEAPEKYKKKEKIKLENKKVLNFVTIKEISKALGRK